MKTDREKGNDLKNLFDVTYFCDIVDRYKIQRQDVISTPVDILASSIGSLTNPQRIFDTFLSKGEKESDALKLSF